MGAVRTPLSKVRHAMDVRGKESTHHYFQGRTRTYVRHMRLWKGMLNINPWINMDQLPGPRVGQVRRKVVCHFWCSLCTTNP